MKKDGYEWWMMRIKRCLELYDAVRIDHFRGLSAFYSIPASDTSALNGKWIDGPKNDFFDCLNKRFPNAKIIAEDLGTLDQGVTDLLKYSNLYGMRVFQFGFDGDSENRHLTENYTKSSIAYTGTHDNDTLLGFLFSLPEEHRRHVFRYCGYDGEDVQIGFSAVLREMYASHAGLLVLPAQDLLRFGEDTRINRPGTAAGNWRYRLTEEQLDSLDPTVFRSLANLYGR